MWREELFYEGYQYLPFQVYEEKTGLELPEMDSIHEYEPEGEEWDEESEEDFKRICPKLVEVYGF